MSPDRITLGPQIRIDSWKAIAAFVGRDERTVRRWEKQRRLPVYRAAGERGRVFAYKNELLLWLHAPAATGSTRNGARDVTRIGLPDLAVERAAERSVYPEPGAAAMDAPVRLEPTAIGTGAHGRWFFWLAAAALAIFLLCADSFHARMEAAPALLSTSARPKHAVTAVPEPIAASESEQQQAREFYLRGRYYWSLRTRDGLRKALDNFTQAIVQDARYAPAYAGLAETYELMPQYSAMPIPDAFPRALAAARRAVSLDPNSAEAHRALAFSLFYWDWNISGSFSEFQRALALDPNDAEAHHWYATSLFTLRRSAEARAEIHRARVLNPGSRSILADQILIDSAAGVDRAQCLNSLRELARSEPGFGSPPRYIRAILLDTNDYAGWIAEINRAPAASHSPADQALARAARRGWERGGERALFEELRKAEGKQFAKGQTSGFDLALTCLHLGDKRSAVRYLQSAYRVHDFRLLSLLHDPPDAALRGYAPYENLRHAVESRMSTVS